MRITEEKSKLDALIYCGIARLPDADTKEHIWLQAIAKIRKSDGMYYYAYVRKNDNLENVVIKDFGSMSRIVDIVEFYPFDYLQDNYVKFFKTQNKEERINYLTENGVNCDSSMTLKELNFEVIKLAAQKQMKYNENKVH